MNDMKLCKGDMNGCDKLPTIGKTCYCMDCLQLRIEALRKDLVDMAELDAIRRTEFEALRIELEQKLLADNRQLSARIAVLEGILRLADAAIEDAVVVTTPAVAAYDTARKSVDLPKAAK